MTNRLDNFIKHYTIKYPGLFDLFVCLYYNDYENYYLIIFQKSMLNKIKDKEKFGYLLESDGRLFYYDNTYDG